ncbi:hypothetical protein BJ508DRAFT_344575 [Ascobolus immersus RN42]|uniref:Uncharacterized protein n=1 Tax=Ascobolus immersus RN42 TaxID=1160509 RepID=A0A3N4ILA3_ASCIM|nr:hypothetical protein BJ508DRAFT_344575 [Ascobolus immersus RN42]
MLKPILCLAFLAILAYQCYDYSTTISFHHSLNPTGRVAFASTFSLENSIRPPGNRSFADIARRQELHKQLLPFLSNATAGSQAKYRRIPTSSLYPILITPDTNAQCWNPTILALPSFSQHQYIVVARVLTDGSHHLNVACLANWVYHDSLSVSIKALVCDPTTVQILNVPPTVSGDCGENKRMGHFNKFPGFHDTRLTWMRTGDVLAVAGSGYDSPSHISLSFGYSRTNKHTNRSMKTCFGMFGFSLLPYYRPVSDIIGSATPFGLGPHISLPYITEIERPPPYGFFEKNWIPFHSSSGLYFQSDHGPGVRTIAKHYGFGKVSGNITQPDEPTCFPPGVVNESGKGGAKWHLATGVLEVLLCKRDEDCQGKASVFVAVVHRKITNKFGLMAGSGKYEKFVVVYDGKAPFRTLAFGRRAILYGEERMDGFVDLLGGNIAGKDGFAGTVPTVGEAKYRKTFTYTLSLAWDVHDKVGKAEEMTVGYLDDDVVAGVGVGDNGVFVGRIKMGDLLNDLREC